MTIADWNDLSSGLTTLLTRLAGATTEAVHDGGPAIGEQDTEWTMPGDVELAELSWRMISDLPNGQADQKITYDPLTIPEGDTYTGPGAPLGSVIYQSGQQRRLTFEVQAKSQTSDPVARTYLSKIAQKIVLPSSRDALRELGLALQGTPRMHDAGSLPNEDGRMVRVWALEFVCNGTTNVTDDPISTIETFETTFTIAT